MEQCRSVLNASILYIRARNQQHPHDVRVPLGSSSDQRRPVGEMRIATVVDVRSPLQCFHYFIDWTHLCVDADETVPVDVGCEHGAGCEQHGKHA
eukprot:4036869-Pyramimonas_sp.AAC.1